MKLRCISCEGRLFDVPLVGEDIHVVNASGEHTGKTYEHPGGYDFDRAMCTACESSPLNLDNTEEVIGNALSLLKELGVYIDSRKAPSTHRRWGVMVALLDEKMDLLAEEKLTDPVEELQ